MTRRWLLAALSLGALSACRKAQGARCARCGMRVADGSRWRAGATRRDGTPLAFDTPGCLLRYRFEPGGLGLRDPWVIEHYGPAERRASASSVRFVPASRVRGPMGDDWIPVAPESVERFLRDHGGTRGFAYEEITPEALAAQ